MYRMEKLNVSNSRSSWRKSKAVKAFALTASVVACSIPSVSTAGYCWGPGWACFWDSNERHNVVNVGGWNSDWSLLSGNLNDRANNFFNEGTTHTFIVHRDRNYRGPRVFVYRGRGVTAYMGPSSNSWRRAN